MRRRFATLAGFWRGFLAGIAVVAAGLVFVKSIEFFMPKQVLGHLSYQAADPKSLLPVEEMGRVYLREAAAKMFLAMQARAKKDGVYLVPMSGFRDYRRQHDLFFHGARLKNQSKAERSLVCAPPGFSEHHTGYSLDIGDGAFVGEVNEVDSTFKDTASYRWLVKNAGRYDFEMSFPEDKNKRRIAYEPWHWRYVGDLHSFQTFFYDRVIPKWVSSK